MGMQIHGYHSRRVVAWFIDAKPNGNSRRHLMIPANIIYLANFSRELHALLLILTQHHHPPHPELLGHHSFYRLVLQLEQ
jgi:hypothetical protein